MSASQAPACATPGAAATEAVLAALRAGVPHRAGELLVQFRADAGHQEKEYALRSLAIEPLGTVRFRSARDDGLGDLERVRVPPRLGLAEAITVLDGDPVVAFAEPDWSSPAPRGAPGTSATPSGTASAPLAPWRRASRWGLLGGSLTPEQPYGSGALDAWRDGRRCRAETAVGFVGGVVAIDQRQLRDAVWVNPLERPNRRDDDGDGLVDDLRGWDFADNDASVGPPPPARDPAGGTPPPSPPIDPTGTHAIGVIAAQSGDAPVSACPGARVVVTRFAGAEGGRTSDAIRAIEYLTMLRRQGRLSVAAILLGWDGGGPSAMLADAVAGAGRAGIVVAVPAGDDGLDLDTRPRWTSVTAPALGNVLTVAALGADGSLASTSNRGAATVQLAAPGVDIRGPAPAGRGQVEETERSGTLVAAAHVAAAAALYQSLNPCADAPSTRRAILGHAVQTGGLEGWIAGARRLDMSRLVADLGCGRGATTGGR